MSIMSILKKNHTWIKIVISVLIYKMLTDVYIYIYIYIYLFIYFVNTTSVNNLIHGFVTLDNYA